MGVFSWAFAVVDRAATAKPPFLFAYDVDRGKQDAFEAALQVRTWRWSLSRIP